MDRPIRWETVTAENLAESEQRLAQLNVERAALDKRYRSDPQRATLTLAEEARLLELIKWVDMLSGEIKAIRKLAA